VFWSELKVMWGIIFIVAVPLALLSYLTTRTVLRHCHLQNQQVMWVIHGILVSVQISVPHALLAWVSPNPIISGIASATSTCLALKTHSFFVRVGLPHFLAARTPSAHRRNSRGNVSFARKKERKLSLGLRGSALSAASQGNDPSKPSQRKKMDEAVARDNGDDDDAADNENDSEKEEGGVEEESILHFLRFLFVPELVYNRAAMMMMFKNKAQRKAAKLRNHDYSKNGAIKNNIAAKGAQGNSGEAEEERGRGQTEGAELVFTSIRWSYILNNWLQGAACLLWIAVVSCQRIVPMLLRTGSVATINSLQLCVPANLCWFLAFYCVFKANFAILAEVTHYPIKRFYEDWWNATTVEDFWRRWNVPVHDFAVHHVFHPCMRSLKLSARAAGAVVFVLSALLHELTFAVAFRCPNCYFITMGMLLQVPLIHYSRHFRGRRRGNILVWMNFVLGITLMAQLYFHQWYECCSRHDRLFIVFYRGGGHDDFNAS